MMLSAVVIALLLQAPPAPGRQPAAAVRPPVVPASVAGTVVHSGTGEPVANVRVSLARTDASLGAFAQMVAGDHPPFEVTIPGEFLAMMAAEMAGAAGGGDIPSEMAAEAKAMASLPLADIQELIVSPNGEVAIVPKSAPPIFTDAEGRFAFAGLDPGTYKLVFASNGYARQVYGQRGLGGTGIPLVLGPGQAKSDILMRMTAVGVVSGHIADSTGRPAAGVPVELFRFAYDESGQKKTQRAASTQTDDRGEYRIYSLSPGRYYLSAGNQPGKNGAGDSSAAMEMAGLGLAVPYFSSNRIPQNYALSYYPGVADVGAATPIEVAPGADVDSIDLSLTPQQSYRVRGRLVDPRSGQPPQSASISITAQTADPLDLMGGYIEFSDGGPNYNAVEGTFEVRSISPGAYTVTADLPAPNPPPRSPDLASMSQAEQRAYFEAMSVAEMARPRASATVNVVNADVEGVVLMVGVTGSVSGHIKIDADPANPAPQLEFVRVQLRNGAEVGFRGNGDAPQPRPTKSDGAFSVSNVWPGEYRLVVTGLPSGFYIKAARLGETDVLNAPLRVAGTDISALDIAIGSNAGQIEGTIADADGQPAPGARVVLIPDQQRQRTELFRPVTADPNGHFTIPAVTPGDYKLAAWEAIEPFAFFDPDLIKQADEHGKPLHVAESSKVTVNVNPIPAAP